MKLIAEDGKRIITENPAEIVTEEKIAKANFPYRNADHMQLPVMRDCWTGRIGFHNWGDLTPAGNYNIRAETALQGDGLTNLFVPGYFQITSGIRMTPIAGGPAGYENNEIFNSYIFFTEDNHNQIYYEDEDRYINIVGSPHASFSRAFTMNWNPENFGGPFLLRATAQFKTYWLAEAWSDGNTWAWNNMPDRVPGSGQLHAEFVVDASPADRTNTTQDLLRDDRVGLMTSVLLPKKTRVAGLEYAIEIYLEKILFSSASTIMGGRWNTQNADVSGFNQWPWQKMIIPGANQLQSRTQWFSTLTEAPFFSPMVKPTY